MREIEQRRDVLIGRVIDGEASSADWQSLRAMAEDDRTVWTDLEQTQRMHEVLSAGVGDACASATGVDLPASRVEHGLSRRLSLAGTWGGWLAAAALGLAWTLGVPVLDRGRGAAGALVPGLGSDYVRIQTPEDALRAYVDRGRDAGRVVGLVPDPRIVQTRSLPDGSGIEVLYVREILERRFVEQVYRLGQDEAGNMRPIQVRITPASDRPF